jgi:hypothetical protein
VVTPRVRSSLLPSLFFSLLLSCSSLTRQLTFTLRGGVPALQFVAYLTRHGWAGKGVAGVRVKAKEVADKVSKKTKDAVKDRKS